MGAARAMVDVDLVRGTARGGVRQVRKLLNAYSLSTAVEEPPTGVKISRRLSKGNGELLSMLLKAVQS